MSLMEGGKPDTVLCVNIVLGSCLLLPVKKTYIHVFVTDLLKINVSYLTMPSSYIIPLKSNKELKKDI